MNEINLLKLSFKALGVELGDGVFVHASMKSIGHLKGGPHVLISALKKTVGLSGLVVMPAFSDSKTYIGHISDEKVRSSHISKDSCNSMGLLAESFRKSEGVVRSSHPCVSVAMWGNNCSYYVRDHPLNWSTGSDSPFGKLVYRTNMKIILIGVGWNRCTALHTAEYLSPIKRLKSRRINTVGLKRKVQDITTIDVADDNDTFFPIIGSEFEAKNKVKYGKVGCAKTMICDYTELINFAKKRIEYLNHANCKNNKFYPIIELKWGCKNNCVTAYYI